MSCFCVAGVSGLPRLEETSLAVAEPEQKKKLAGTTPHVFANFVMSIHINFVLKLRDINSKIVQVCQQIQVNVVNVVPLQ